MTLFSIGSFSIELLIFEKKINSPLVSALKKNSRGTQYLSRSKNTIFGPKKFWSCIRYLVLPSMKFFKIRQYYVSGSSGDFM